MNVRIEKQFVMKNKVSMVLDKFCEEGILNRLIKYSKKIEHKKVNHLKEIQKGDILFVDGQKFNKFLKTTPITQILEQTEDILLFKTKTSVYKLYVLDTIFDIRI